LERKWAEQRVAQKENDSVDLWAVWKAVSKDALKVGWSVYSMVEQSEHSRDDKSAVNWEHQ
jgi:hypothetical protein